MKIVLIFVLVLANYFVGFTQTEWAPIGAEWYIDHQEMVPFQAHGYIHYKVMKDTLVDYQVVRLIRKQQIRFDGHLIKTDSLYAYEKDSKIYYSINGKFLMFYDFSKQVGDIIKYQPEVLDCDSVSPIIVKSVKTVNMNGLPVKEMSFSYTLLKKEFNHAEINFSFNEKLCIDYFYPPCGIGDQFVIDYLRCYHDNVIQYVEPFWYDKYPSSPCDTLIDMRVNISELKSSKMIQIYPNPTKGIVNVNSKDAISKITIYDLQGRKLLGIKKNRILDVDLSHLPQGIYIMQSISSKGEFFINKILKSN